MATRCMHLVSVCTLVLLSLFSSGCRKGEWLPVSGTVTCDGKPLADGSISFEPTDGAGPTGGGSIRDGEYQVLRVMPGKKIVRILAVRKTGRKVPPPMSGPSTAATRDEVEQFIPAAYNTQSKLTAEVRSGGSNQFEFALKSR